VTALWAAASGCVVVHGEREVVPATTRADALMKLKALPSIATTEIATAGDSETSCQPEAVSPLNVASASITPVLDHRCPTCVPVFRLPL